MFRAARCWVALLLCGVLAGCATAPVGGFGPVTSSSRRLLAMSDGPVAGEGQGGPSMQGYNVPGRNPDSQMPWTFFLGNAAHRLISFMYGVKHPGNRVYYNTKSIKAIIDEARVGDVSHLLPDESSLRPDITDVTRRSLFEVKPGDEQALKEGREEAGKYLAALNRTLLTGKLFSGGTGFHGEILVRFAGGQHIWRLEWKNAEPGVVQYQWTRSQQRFESEAAAYEAGQWVELTEQEMRQYGGWVGQAVDGMISRRERLATLSGAVGIGIEVMGSAATVFFSWTILGRMGSGPGAQQPPVQGGGQVIPFPARPPPIAPPAQVPAAAGMSLPR